MDNNKDVVYMLPKVIYPNGELQYLCKLLPTPADLILRRFMPNCDKERKQMNNKILKEIEEMNSVNPIYEKSRVGGGLKYSKFCVARLESEAVA